MLTPASEGGLHEGWSGEVYIHICPNPQSKAHQSHVRQVGWLGLGGAWAKPVLGTGCAWVVGPPPIADRRWMPESIRARFHRLHFIVLEPPIYSGSQAGAESWSARLH